MEARPRIVPVVVYCCVAGVGNGCIVCVSGELPLAPTATRWGLHAVDLHAVDVSWHCTCRNVMYWHIYMQCRGEWKLARVSFPVVVLLCSRRGKMGALRVCCGRASTRPYSYAMGFARGDLHAAFACGGCVAALYRRWMCRGMYMRWLCRGIYMQCRGEWKLARVSTPWWYCCVAGVGMGALRVFRASFHSPLQLRGGVCMRWMCCGIVHAVVVLACTYICSVGASGSSPAYHVARGVLFAREMWVFTIFG